MFCSFIKKVVKNDNFSSVSMYYSSLNILSTFPINNIELYAKHLCVEIYSTEALKGHRQRNNYLQCWLEILDKMRNIRSS